MYPSSAVGAPASPTLPSTPIAQPPAAVQQADTVGQQALAKRKLEDGSPKQVKARCTIEDRKSDLQTFFLQMQHLPFNDADKIKYTELIGELAQKSVAKADLTQWLTFLYIINRYRPSLSDANKKNLLTLVAQVLRCISPSEPSALEDHEELKPMVQWLCELKTGLLLKEDEETLAKAISYFIRHTGSCYEVSKNIVRSTSLTNALPAALSRLAAFPLTVETFLPILAMLGLREMKNQKPGDDVYTSLKGKLEAVSDVQMGSELLLELDRIDQISPFVSLSPELVEILMKLYQRCSVYPLSEEQRARQLRGLAHVLKPQTQIAEVSRTLHWTRLSRLMLDLIAKSKDPHPITLCVDGLQKFPIPRLSKEDKHNYLQQISVICQRLSQDRLSLSDLSALLWLLNLLKCRDKTTMEETIAKMIRQYDHEKLPEVPCDPILSLKNLWKIAKTFQLEFQTIGSLLCDLVCRAVEDGKQIDQLFFQLNEFTGLKGGLHLDEAAKTALCTLYEPKQKQSINEEDMLYGLLFLSQSLPKDRFLEMATDFIRDHYHFPDPLSLNNVYTMLLNALSAETQITSDEDENVEGTNRLKPILALIANLVTSSVPPICATTIFSHLLVLCVNWEEFFKNDVFIKPLLKMAQKQKLPPLTPEACSALSTWVLQPNAVTMEMLQTFVAHPQLKLLLPEDADLFVEIMRKQAEKGIEQLTSFWNAVADVVEAGYPNQIDIDCSVSLQSIICSELSKLDISKLSFEEAWSIQMALIALYNRNFFKLPAAMPDEEKNAKKAQLEGLVQQITNRANQEKNRLG